MEVHEIPVQWIRDRLGGPHAMSFKHSCDFLSACEAAIRMVVIFVILKRNLLHTEYSTEQVLKLLKCKSGYGPHFAVSAGSPVVGHSP
jgi:hypothetical protein